MKKMIVVLILNLFSLSSFTQTISFDEMIKLQGQQLNEANDFIIKKGLNLDKTNSSETIWKKGNLYFGYKIMEDSSIEVSLQTQDKKQYEYILNSIKGKGMKVTKTFNVTEPYEGLVIQYEGKNYIVNCKVMTNNEANAYSFTLAKK